MSIRYLSGINVDSNTLFVDDANNRVGIGTNSPSRQLELVGADAYIQLTRSSTSTQATLGFNTGATNDWLIRTGDGSTSNLQFYSYGTSSYVMTIARSSGNVGIGTTAPSSILHVDGIDPYVRINNVNSANNQGIKISYNYSDTHGFHLTYNANAAGAYIDNTYPITSGQPWGDIYFRQNSAGTMVTRMTIKADGGNVGIGTTSPSDTLDLYQAANTTAIRLTSAGVGSKIYRLTSQLIGVSNAGFGIQNATDGRYELAIDGSGNVGIGTTSPAYKLDVNGSINARSNSQVSGNAQVFTIDGTNHAYYAWSVAGSRKAYAGFGSSGSTTFELINENTGGFIIGTNGGQQLIITSAGNVGIGTTSPSYKASVVAANGNYWNGTAFTGTPLALSIENSQAGGYDSVLIYNQADSGGTLKNSGAIGMVGTGPWTAGNNASQVSDMYFLVRNSSGSISERLRIKSTGAAQLKAYGSGSFTGTVAYNLAVDSSGNIIETAGGVVDGSGTANYVSKWSDANTLTDSQLFDNGTNVGIGTTSPTYKLQVNGDSYVGGNLTSTGYGFFNGEGLGTSIRVGGIYGNLGLYVASTYDMQFDLGWDGVFKFTRGNTERMRITSAGNVGIGTTSPSTRLEVLGDTGVITIRTSYPADLSQRGALLWKDATNITGAIDTRYDGTTVDMYFGSLYSSGYNSTTRMVIKGNGNVGIGTTAPGAKLTVYTGGASAISGTNDGIRLQVSSYNNSARNTIAWHQDGSDLNLGRFGLEWNSGTSQMNFVWRDVYNSGAGVSELMRLQGNGNLGIGTTAPGYKLDVVGAPTTNDWGLRLQNTNTGGWGVSQFFNIYGYASSPASDFSALQIRADYPGYGRISFVVKEQAQSSALESLVLRGNGQVYMNAGNVGIGTTSPAQKLDVNGTIRAGIAGNSSANIPALLVTSSGTGDAQAAIAIQQATSEGDTIIFADYEPYVEWGISTENAANKIQFTAGTSTGNLGSKTLYNNAGDARTAYIKFDHDLTSGQTLIGGNVGIGTTTPGYKLDVSGDINFSNTLKFGGVNVIHNGSTDVYGNIRVLYSASTLADGMYINYNSAGGGGAHLRFFANSTNERMRIDANSGYVGINTTSPQALLHVQGTGLMTTFRNGSAGADEYSQLEFVAGSRTAYIWLGNQNTSSWAGPGGLNIYTANGNMDLWTSGVQRVRIDTSGNVGIGTTSPSQALHVSGNIRVTGAYYDSSNSAGSSGQVLSSTGSGTAWVNQGEATATSLYDLLPAARTTYAWSVQLTAGTWADIFSSNTVLSNGTWMVQVYVDDWAVGGQQYQETYSGVMSWGSANTTNQGGAEAISEVVLHRSGHAANAGNFYLRTVERVTSTLLLQGMSNQTYSAASTINFKFVKIF